ncbi:hypothetical protein [Brevundimonas nasdae]|uniref:hypothetical protein n=1 Tax=Brevundimonas nasdae TaxID=172043 RepID=UPI0028A25A0F|nr:hypothetical protein [Brevundimonas nasdae]
MSYAILGAVFMIGMAGFAFLKGGDTERHGAGAYLLAWFASIIVQQNADFGPARPAVLFAIDTALLVAFAAISWKSKRSWPVWASGLQLLTVMSHIMILLDTRLPLASLYTVTNLSGYLIIGCILWGTFWAWQERKASRGIE